MSMYAFRRSFLFWSLVLPLGAFSLSLNAQGLTLFVSSSGSDKNECSREAPCRTFQRGADQAPAGGQVIALDSAEYGPVVILRALSLIAAPGVYAGISPAPGPGGGSFGVTVNASSSDSVALVGLTMAGFSQTGVRANGARRVTVDRCVIRGNGRGIETSQEFTFGSLLVCDTEVSQSFPNQPGIGVFAGSLVAERCRIRGNSTGIQVYSESPTATTRATIRDSEVSGSDFGIFPAPGGGSVEVTLERDLIDSNVIGVYSFTTSGTVRLSGCTITNNLTGLQNTQGGEILSRGNNTLAANGTDVQGTLGSFQPR